MGEAYARATEACLSGVLKGSSVEGEFSRLVIAPVEERLGHAQGHDIHRTSCVRGRWRCELAGTDKSASDGGTRREPLTTTAPKPRAA
jgi:hypothetical protein